VYRLLRAAWAGGGTNELFYDAIERRRVFLWFLVGSVYIAAYNVVLMVVVASFPPFADRYAAAIRCGTEGSSGSPQGPGGGSGVGIGPPVTRHMEKESCPTPNHYPPRLVALL
jgi:hypothetical protein